MKRVILISLDEFTANGGKLELGRMLYQPSETTFVEGEKRTEVQMMMLEWGKYTGTTSDDIILVEGHGFRSRPVSRSLVCVKVEVKPVYE